MSKTRKVERDVGHGRADVDVAYTTITLDISPEMAGEIERMTDSGYWGTTHKETAEELLRLALRREA